MFVVSDKEQNLLSYGLSNEARRPDDDMLQELLFELLGQGLIDRRIGAEGLFHDGETVFLPAAERSRKICLYR